MNEKPYTQLQIEAIEMEWYDAGKLEGAFVERERSIGIIEGHRHVFSEEHFDCDVCVTLNQVVALIKGENE
jgi:DNA gyrase inhibitor GyrI